MAYGFGRDLGGYFRAFSNFGNTPPERKFRNYWQVTQRVINTSPRRPYGNASNTLVRNNYPPIKNTNGQPYDPTI